MSKATHKRVATEYIDGVEFGLDYTDGNYKIIRREGKWQYSEALDTQNEDEARAMFHSFTHN